MCISIITGSLPKLAINGLSRAPLARKNFSKADLPCLQLDLNRSFPTLFQIKTSVRANPKSYLLKTTLICMKMNEPVDELFRTWTRFDSEAPGNYSANVNRSFMHLNRN